ncbi:MAG: homocysteine S-methyltransferase family protein [Rhodospirillales bacterium]|nr:homocysteine S-methyltransferase family protein [Rhodospirillales bacterium]
MYKTIDRILEADRTVILDGGTGTDIQRRGAPMSGETWCAEVNRTHPQIVEAVHRDYIAAGAHVITANTFATSALSFNALGRDGELLELDRLAVATAKKAAAGTKVAVAGSVSTMRPVIPGSDRTDKQREWPEAEARRLFEAKVQNLAKAGADFLMMEMMRDADYSVWASEAAIATGLPVWIGISLESGKDGKLRGFGREDQLFEDFGPKLAALNPAAICIMHTSPNDTDEAVALLKTFWQGAMGAYPESGYFKMPDWQFIDVIPPTLLLAKAKTWKEIGVSILGGCCGIGPDHIKALSKEFG